MSSVVSIANKDSRIGICVFDGDCYKYYQQFYDDLCLSRTIRIIESINPERVVSSVTGSFKIALKHRFNCIHFINVKLNPATFNNLTSVEHKSIKLISTFLDHTPVLKVENNRNIVGYAGKYSIQSGKYDCFFVNEDIIKNIHQLPKLNQILENTVTKFGRLCAIDWISNPCISEDDIQKRRSFIEYISSMVPKIKKLLKDCRFPSLDRPINFFRLRRSLKAALLLQKLVQEKTVLKNKKVFLKLYKMIRIFDKDGISDQKDTILDEHRSKFRHISSVLEKTSKILAAKYNIPLSTVYFPNIGFFIESSVPFDNPSFTVGDKFYSKNNEMNELDHKYGDPYQEINVREASIILKITKKILRIDFSELYYIVGYLDASVSLYLSLTGHFACLKPDSNSLELSPYERFNQKTILTYQISTDRIVELIVINQIGGMVPDDVKQLPIFRSVAIKRRCSSFKNEHTSTFQDEVISLARIFRNVQEGSICIIEGIGESTSPREGIALLAAFIECVSCGILIVSSGFQEDELKEYLGTSKVNILSNTENSNVKHNEDICDLFTKYTCGVYNK